MEGAVCRSPERLHPMQPGGEGARKGRGGGEEPPRPPHSSRSQSDLAAPQWGSGALPTVAGPSLDLLHCLP